MEAAQEAQERAEAEELVEAYEEVVAEEVAEKIVEEVIAEEIAEEIVEEAVAEEIVAEVIEEAVAEEIAQEVVEAELEAEAEEESAPREKPAVPGAHLEVDIVPEGADPLGRVTEPADPYASVAEAYEQDAEARPRASPMRTRRSRRADLDRCDRSRLGRAIPRDRQAQDGDRACDAAAGHRHLSGQRARSGGAFPAHHAAAQHPSAA